MSAEANVGGVMKPMILSPGTGMMGRNDDSLFPYFVYGSINGVEYRPSVPCSFMSFSVRA